MHVDSATNADTLAAPSRLGPRALLRVLAIAGGALFVALIAVRTNLEFVGEGDTFGFGKIEELELFGRFTVYRDAESLTQMDLLNGFLLIAIASTSFFVALILSVADRIERRFLFFLVAAIGTAFLATDEVLGIHETIGANLHFLARIPGIHHPDDAVFAAYAVPVAVFGYWFRTVIRSSRRGLWLLALGCGLYALGAGMDVVSAPFEEYVEPLASFTLLLGFVTLGYQQYEFELRRADS
jgi:hypothetical protein